MQKSTDRERGNDPSSPHDGQQSATARERNTNATCHLTNTATALSLCVWFIHVVPIGCFVCTELRSATILDSFWFPDDLLGLSLFDFKIFFSEGVCECGFYFTFSRFCIFLVDSIPTQLDGLSIPHRSSENNSLLLWAVLTSFDRNGIFWWKHFCKILRDASVQQVKDIQQTYPIGR